MSVSESKKPTVVDVDKHLSEEKMADPERNTRKLVLCFLGIFISYFVYGILQEKITKGHYGDEGDKFTYTLALVFAQCIINAAFAQTAITTMGVKEDTAPQTMYAAMAFSYLGAMVCSNHALQYINYPTQVLGKSIKPIPVMILGVLYAGKRYPFQKYLFVMLIVIGVAIFTYKDKKPTSTEAEHTLGWGEILLLISLLLDGMTGGIQDKLRKDYIPQTHRIMLYLNVWALLYLAVALVLTGEGLEFIHFAIKYPIVLFNMLTFSLCSAVGQHFIFMTVTNFGPLMCSIITTTRKFFTILGSVLIFGHPMFLRQWIGTIFVFIGLVLDNVYGKEVKNKVPQK